MWGTALGPPGRDRGRPERSLEEVQGGPNASAVWFPAWYQTSGGAPFASAAASGGSGGSLFSGSGVPDIGGMMSALGTIGNSPASSGGGGGGGGFSGGWSGGGGGGAGGGF